MKNGTISKSRRVTQSIKENVVLTFELLGGVENYANWARKNPDKFYDHWIKMLPAEIKAEVSVSHDFTGILERARNRVGSGQRSLDVISGEVLEQVFNTEEATVIEAVDVVDSTL